MKKLGDFLNQAVAKKGLGRQLTSAQICFYADKWGKGRFQVISFSKGTLKVSVSSASAASELQIEEEKIVDFINKHIKRTIVKKIHILQISR